MKMYFYLQIKRALKIFPFVLAVTGILLVALTTVLAGVIGLFNDRDENKRYAIAITGDTSNEYLQWGIAAVKAFDETKFSIDFVEMTEADAQEALSAEKIVAYVVLPENFVEQALYGEVEPITYVTTVGMEDITSLFKKEVTSLITDMVVYSQKGVYGLYDALEDADGADRYRGEIAIEYTELIFQRSELYSLEELGISHGLSMEEYFVCAIVVVLLTLIGLPFVVVYIKKDYALCRSLLSRGYPVAGQLGCEYAVHFLSMLLQAAAILLIVGVGAAAVPALQGTLFSADLLESFALKIVPVVVMLAAFNIMIFELANDSVSGVLLHFFVGLGLCYISGCMYPIYAFPKVVQQLAVFLPTGLARGYLATCFTLDTAAGELIGLLLYAVLFFGVAVGVRAYKTASKRG